MPHPSQDGVARVVRALSEAVFTNQARERANCSAER